MNVIITGAGRGIGLEMVQQLGSQPGHRIIALSRNISALNDLVSGKVSMGKLLLSEVIPYSFDLAKGDYSELISFVDLHIQKLDILINNAGLLVNKPFSEISPRDIEEVFSVNVSAVILLTQAMLPLMGKGSHIVNITSIGGCQGSVKFPGLTIYSASKGAVHILTESMAVEFKERGISANALALGAVKTEMFARAFPGQQAQVSSAEMASLIVDFALKGNAWFNGKVLPVSLSVP